MAAGSNDQESILRVSVQGYTNNMWTKTSGGESMRRGEGAEMQKKNTADKMLDSDVWKPVSGSLVTKEMRRKIVIAPKKSVRPPKIQDRLCMEREENPDDERPTSPTTRKLAEYMETPPPSSASLSLSEETRVNGKRSRESMGSKERLERIAVFQKSITHPKPYLTLYEREKRHVPDTPSPCVTTLSTVKSNFTSPSTSLTSTISTSSDCFEDSQQELKPEELQKDLQKRRNLCNCIRRPTASLGSYVSRSLEEYSGKKVPEPKMRRRNPELAREVEEITNSEATVSPITPTVTTTTVSTPTGHKEKEPVRTLQTMEMSRGTRGTPKKLDKARTPPPSGVQYPSQNTICAQGGQVCASTTVPHYHPTTCCGTVQIMQAGENHAVCFTVSEAKCWLLLGIFISLIFAYRTYLPTLSQCS